MQRAGGYYALSYRYIIESGPHMECGGGTIQNDNEGSRQHQLRDNLPRAPISFLELLLLLRIPQDWKCESPWLIDGSFIPERMAVPEQMNFIYPINLAVYSQPWLSMAQSQPLFHLLHAALIPLTACILRHHAAVLDVGDEVWQGKRAVVWNSVGRSKRLHTRKVLRNRAHDRNSKYFFHNCTAGVEF